MNATKEVRLSAATNVHAASAILRHMKARIETAWPNYHERSHTLKDFEASLETQLLELEKLAQEAAAVDRHLGEQR